MAANPEIEAVALDLLNFGQCQSEAPHVFGVSHSQSFRDHGHSALG